MGQYVVAISIDKVQAFLYHMLQAEIQEHQSDSGSLSDIIRSSMFISNQMYEDVGIEGSSGEFSGHIIEKLLVCSGMCIFTTSLEEEKILQRLDRLFERFYLQNSGQLLLKYVYFEKKIACNEDKLSAIRECKSELRKQKWLNHIIKRNQNLLFEFPDENTKNSQTNRRDSHEVYPAFAPTINALFTEEVSDNPNHFRIAVIKADLDGMGHLFDNIRNYNVYDAISKTLTSYINFNYLHELTKEMQRKDRDFKLYPLYMAGDDLFYAVPVSKLLNGVKISKDILDKVNEEIEKICNRHNVPTLQLSISIGIDFTFNREPIRYYYERVQRQVECAKSAPPLKKDKKTATASYAKVCINHYVFYDGQTSDNIHYPSWMHFRNNVKRLKIAMEEGFAAHHFLYGLLNKIQDRTINSSSVKYSNAVLYHLLPKYLDSGNENLRNAELLLIDSIIEQLLVPAPKSEQNKRHGSKPSSKKRRPRSENILSFENEQRKRLERYIRLLLLFSDTRFQITGNSEVTIDFGKHQSRVKSRLFNKTMKYMFHISLGQPDRQKSSNNKHDMTRMRDLFVKEARYKPDDSAKTYPVSVYRTLRISGSMFHRFKKMDKQQIAAVADMIRATNTMTKEEIEQQEIERNQQKKAPPGLYYDHEKFLELAQRTKMWTNDYIDTLFIFYKYKELSIRFKSIFSKQRIKTSGVTGK